MNRPPAVNSFADPDMSTARDNVGKKKRVGFTGATNSAELDAPTSSVAAATRSDGATTTAASLTPPSGSNPVSGTSSPGRDVSPHRNSSLNDVDTDKSHLPTLSAQQTREIHQALGQQMPRPAIRRVSSHQSRQQDLNDSELEESDHDGQKAIRRARAKEALRRGQRLAENERLMSASSSRHASPDRSINRPNWPGQIALDDIPLESFRTATVEQDETDSDDSGVELARGHRGANPLNSEALRLVRKHTVHHTVFHDDAASTYGMRSGTTTPIEESLFEDYTPRPKQYRTGVLSSLLKLYGQQNPASSSGRPKSAHLRTGSHGGYSASSTPQHSPNSSGTSTPIGSYFQFGSRNKSPSSSSLARLVGSSTALGSPSVTGSGEQVSQRLREEQRNATKRPSKRSLLNRLSRVRPEDEARITIHIAETMSRQKYLVKLCRALMMYGSPTHRLEEHMAMSARALEVRAQFLYLPGTMLLSFDDASTHTTEVKLVRVEQGLDLGKLRDVHEVYKDIVHDRVGVDEAMSRLEEVTSKKDKFSKWARIPIYGLASASVGPFAFGARPIDLPVAWFLGCILGVLQLFVAPRNPLYNNVFEIAATIITSFLSRAFGSIRGGDLFCFSALTQSSIALVLPGFIVLTSSLELQSKSLVAGSVRMVYAIIYSLFLGYGITIGASLYGMLDRSATSEVECRNPMEAPVYFAFVPAFTICLIIINQAKWKQAPVMLLISCVGYLVNYYSSLRFSGNTQISNTLGALSIGVLANLYSRIGARLENKLWDVWEEELRPRWKGFQRRAHKRGRPGSKSLEEGISDNESAHVRRKRRYGYGLAASAIMPAIFVQVPSGLAASGSLIAGVTSANQIAGKGTNGTSVATSSTLLSNEAIPLNSTAFVTAFSIIQIAIGITVGLSLSAILVYLPGKRRSGLFSF